jgi:signal transduction histidine kinase
MKKFFSWITKPHPLWEQIVFVLISIFVLVLSSCIYMTVVMRKNLVGAAESAMNFTQANIASDLLEPATTLGGLAETIRFMLVQDFDEEMSSEYMKSITQYALSDVAADERYLSGFTDAYCVFFEYGGKYVSGTDKIHPDDYIPGQQPWYLAALEALGGVAVTSPYIEPETGEFILSYARQIIDGDNRSLGIVGLDISLKRIAEYAVNTTLSDGGYGILLDENLTVIAHPNSAMLNKPLDALDMSFIPIAHELRQGRNISERMAVTDGGTLYIVFFRQLYNGWHMGVLTPLTMYYQDVITMAAMLGSMGLGMAGVLIILLVGLDKTKNRLDIESRTKSNFLTTISHEIRTPLNAILGIAAIHLQDEELPPSMQESFNKIYNSGDLLLGIINDMLDLSKIEAGKMEVTNARYDFASMLNDTIQLNILRAGDNPSASKLP